MRLGSRAKLTIGAGAIAAATFTFLGIREMSRAVAPEPTAQPITQVTQAPPRIVLAATTEPIRTGQTISASMFRNASSDPDEHPTVATTAEVLGKVAARDIPANTLITRDALTPETRLAIRVPVGMRAISIATTDEIAVAGLIRPGDHVDVQAVYPGQDALTGARRDGRSRAETLLQMVQVLAVGGVVVGTGPENAGSENPPEPIAARTVTLALAPNQISTLSLAKNTGALYLSLRNPEDTNLAIAPTAATAPSATTRRAASTARRTPARARPAAQPAAQETIELVIGDQKQEIRYGGASR